MIGPIAVFKARVADEHGMGSYGEQIGLDYDGYNIKLAFSINGSGHTLVIHKTAAQAMAAVITDLTIKGTA